MINFLYVEDDYFSREIMQVLMDVLGYTHLTIFEDSRNFESRLMALTPVPEIIFLDIQVRPLDGYQMLKIIRQHPQFQKTKVIALTASIMATEVDDLRAAGFDSLIGKPINQEIFPQLLNDILNGKEVWDLAWE